jgi:poly-gamma-glutamate capsule biosynthesis protein CapA/YwtB (metallophosphatase superfamily)
MTQPPKVQHGERPAPTIAAAPEPPPPPPNALLVVTSLAGSHDDVSSADVAAAVCGGTMPVTEEARELAKTRFLCDPTTTTTLDELRKKPDGLALTDLEHVTPVVRVLRVDGLSPFFDPKRYPFVSPRSDLVPHLTHFVMTGVTAIARATGVACDQHGVDWLTENLRGQTANADYVHVSNEVSMLTSCKYLPRNTLSFCTKPADMQALADLHVNVVELTGNHGRDFGDDAFRATMTWYGEHKMATYGGGNDPTAAARPLLLPLADKKTLGILGFNEVCEHHECSQHAGEVGAMPWEDAKAFAALARLRDELHVDQAFVTVQFKEWEHERPTGEQVRIAHALIDHGADLVLGSQAHQLQYAEVYKGKPIYYGLGNFLFDQIYRPEVRQAFLLHHFFFKGRLVQSEPVFTLLPDDRKPTLATPAQAAAMRAVVYRQDWVGR